MKKLALILAIATAVAAFAGCSSAPASSVASGSASVSQPASEPVSEPTSEPASEPASESVSAPSSEAASGSAATGDVTMTSSLSDIMDAVLAAAPQDQLPMLMPADMNGGEKYTALTADNSEYNVGVAVDRYAEGIAADAAMSSVAFSVCLVRANSADEAEQLAADIEAGANPRKWICVEAESTIVDYSGDVVILIMTGADLADQLHAGFTALAQ